MAPLPVLLVSLVVAQAPPGAHAPAAEEAPVRREATAREEAEREVTQILARTVEAMQRAVNRVEDLACTFHKREYKGEQLPSEVMALKFRARPRSLYLKWLNPERAGQEAIWRAGLNAERIRAHKGSFPDITVNLAPTSWLAMRGTRHPMTWAGLEQTVRVIARDFETCRARPDCLTHLRDLGPQTVHGAPGHCFEIEADKERCPELHARRAQFCVHRQLALPIELKVWDLEDGAVRLVEEYGYEDLRVNVGLGDSDFDPDNAAYGF